MHGDAPTLYLVRPWCHNVRNGVVEANESMNTMLVLATIQLPTRAIKNWSTLAVREPFVLQRAEEVERRGGMPGENAMENTRCCVIDMSFCIFSCPKNVLNPMGSGPKLPWGLALSNG